MPPLGVIRDTVPLAFIGYESDSPDKQWRFFVTDSLLAADHNLYEAEAIMACLLAKHVVAFQPKGKLAEAVLLRDGLLNQVSVAFGRNPLPVTILLEDTWAVRVTGNPEALRSAIARSNELLRNERLELGLADPLMFVSPPHASSPNLLYVHYDCEREDTGINRYRLIDFRLMNLDVGGETGNMKWT
jgi:hypothetical protein